MSNVIFGYNVAYEEKPQKLVIDSNELSQEFVNQKEKELIAQQKLLQRQKRIEEMQNSGAEIPEGMDAEEFQNLSDSIMGIEDEPAISTAEKEKILEEAKQEAEKIISNARVEADFLIEKANTDATAIKQLAAQEGQRDGYNAGTQQAALELAEEKARLDEQLAAIKRDYENKALSMEKDVVDVCCDVFSKVFMAELSGLKPVLFHLIDNALMNIEPSRQLQIRVNETNCEYIKERKEQILERVGSEAVVDIISDPTLLESQCIIETDGGLFDCSIDTELDELIRRIKVLS